MKYIHRFGLSDHLSAPKFACSCLHPALSGRHWNLSACKMAQNNAAVRGKQIKVLVLRPNKFNLSFSDSRHDLDALYRFTSGRWLWREREQLATRYVKFDLQKLCRLAASSIGSGSCSKVVKISEGQYNKVLLLTMDDGKEAVAKLPNPNAGRPHFTTASEVATMNFVCNHHSHQTGSLY